MLDEIRSWLLKISNTDNALVKLIQNKMGEKKHKLPISGMRQGTQLQI